MMKCDECGSLFDDSKHGHMIDFADEEIGFCSVACEEAAVMRGTLHGQPFARLAIPDEAAELLQPGDTMTEAEVSDLKKAYGQ